MASAHDLLRALAAGDRLAFLGALNPRIFDVIPRGPLAEIASGVSSGLAQVALNPQPLPPKEAEVGAAVMHRLAASALSAPAGDVGTESLLGEVDDWCGTGWPKRWPFPWPVGPGEPEEWRESQVFLGAALAAAQIAAHYPEGEMRTVFDAAAERLVERALR